MTQPAQPETTTFLLFADQSNQDPLFACLDTNFSSDPEIRQQQIAERAAGLQTQAMRLLNKNVFIGVTEGRVSDNNPMELILSVNESSPLRKAIRARIAGENIKVSRLNNSRPVSEKAKEMSFLQAAAAVKAVHDKTFSACFVPLRSFDEGFVVTQDNAAAVLWGMGLRIEDKSAARQES